MSFRSRVHVLSRLVGCVSNLLHACQPQMLARSLLCPPLPGRRFETRGNPNYAQKIVRHQLWSGGVHPSPTLAASRASCSFPIVCLCHIWALAAQVRHHRTVPRRGPAFHHLSRQGAAMGDSPPADAAAAAAAATGPPPQPNGGEFPRAGSRVRFRPWSPALTILRALATLWIPRK